MDKATLGKTGIEVTKAGFGVLTVGKSQLNLPVSEGAAVLKYALERGINFIDTAQYYETYPYIREALKGTAFEPVISSKCLSPAKKDMQAAIEEARRAVDRDVIDIFLLHEVRSADDFSLRAGAWEALCEAKSKGIVRAIGISTHQVDVAQLACGRNDVDVLFPLINFKSLGIRYLNGQGTCEDMAKAIKSAADKGIGVFGMKAFGGGNLTGEYQRALDYVYSLDGISSMMIGMGKMRDVDDIFDYLEGRMSKDYNPDVREKKIQIDLGDCVGCGTCVKACPNGAMRITDGHAEVDRSKCVTCSYCAIACPERAVILY